MKKPPARRIHVHNVFSRSALSNIACAVNTMWTWILRAGGFFMMFLGLVLFFRPISVLGDVIPFFGSMLAFGTGLFAFVISGVLSVGTVGVAWVVDRPVLGITLLAAALAILVWFAMSGRKKAAATAMSRAAAVKELSPLRR